MMIYVESSAEENKNMPTQIAWLGSDLDCFLGGESGFLEAKNPQ